MSIDNPDRGIRSWRSGHWQDWVNVILGIWLFVSPWILRFAATAPGGEATPGGGGMAGNIMNASWNAWVLGVVIFLVAASAVARLQAWQEWVNLILGIWVFIAPWVLGFSGVPNAAWDHWVVGALVVILAAWDLSTVRRTVATADPRYAGTKPDLRR